MRKGFLFLMAALLVFGACQSKKESTKDIAGHVIIIGLDGWGTWSFEDGDTPFIKEKMKEGSWTLYKRTVRPSISGPNWAAMMNGTPVEVSGITGNEKEPTFKPLVQTEHKAQPTFFHLMRLERPDAETGVVCEWGDFQNYDDTIFMITSDHGHEGTGHGGDSTGEIETPFVVWGKGIKKNHEITEPMIQYDMAATVAKVFHLKTPNSWRGVPMDVFE